MRVCHVTAEHDDAWVEQRDRRRQYLSEQPAGGTHQGDRLRMPGVHEADDVAARCRRYAALGELTCECAAAGVCGQAADRTAGAASRPVRMRDADVADVAGAAREAALGAARAG